MSDTPEWPAGGPVEVIKEALREYIGDGDGADERVLHQYTSEVSIATLLKARNTLDLEELASVHFIASDGIPSVGINTNEDAKMQVIKGLNDLIGEYLDD